MPTPEETYVELLYELHEGRALYEPDPCGGYDHIRIGDVGYFRLGVFRRLFNICYSADDRANRNNEGASSVPDDFLPLPTEACNVIRRNPLGCGARTSSSVRQIGGGSGVSLVAPGIVRAGVNFSFECTRKRGAALITRTPADRYDADAPDEFARYMRENFTQWLVFAARSPSSRGVKLDDLILVTGCDLTREWSTAVFNETDQNGNATLRFDVGGTGSDSSLWGQWSVTTQIPPRVGPPSDRSISNVGKPDNDEYAVEDLTLSPSPSSPAPVPSPAPSSTSPPPPTVVGSLKSRFTSVWGHSVAEIPGPPAAPRTQSIFIRGWRMKRRPMIDSILKIKLRAAAEPKPPAKDRTPSPPLTSIDAAESESDDSVSVVDLSTQEVSKNASLHDIFFDFVFQKCDADIILVHDDEIGELVSAKTNSGFDSLETYLEQHAGRRSISTRTSSKDIAGTGSHDYRTETAIEIRNVSIEAASNQFLALLLDVATNAHLTELPHATNDDNYTFRVVYDTHDQAQNAYARLGDFLTNSRLKDPLVEIGPPQPQIHGVFCRPKALVGGTAERNPTSPQSDSLPQRAEELPSREPSVPIVPGATASPSRADPPSAPEGATMSASRTSLPRPEGSQVPTDGAASSTAPGIISSDSSTQRTSTNAAPSQVRSSAPKHTNVRSDMIQFYNTMQRYGWASSFDEREYRGGWQVSVYVNGILGGTAWHARKALAKDGACAEWLVANGFYVPPP